MKLNQLSELKQLKSELTPKTDIDKHKFNSNRIDVYFFADINNSNFKVSIDTALGLCYKNRYDKLQYELGDNYIII